MFYVLISNINWMFLIRLLELTDWLLSFNNVQTLLNRPYKVES